MRSDQLTGIDREKKRQEILRELRISVGLINANLDPSKDPYTEYNRKIEFSSAMNEAIKFLESI